MKKPNVIEQSTVFSTPWFNMVAKKIDLFNSDSPYYSLQMLDYVSVLALTENQEVLLVRQYRPAVEDYTLELPSGHVETGETPEEAAKRELLEETGYHTDNVELLGCLVPDTGRLSNRLWCYFAPNVSSTQSAPVTEPGIELIVCSQQDVMKYIADQRFDHALNLAVILLAVLKHQGLSSLLLR